MRKVETLHKKRAPEGAQIFITIVIFISRGCYPRGKYDSTGLYVLQQDR